jgi:hypothetical protein
VAEEAKAIVAITIRDAFVDGLGSEIGQDERQRILETAADRLYSLLHFRERNPQR